MLGVPGDGLRVFLQPACRLRRRGNDQMVAMRNSVHHERRGHNSYWTYSVVDVAAVEAHVPREVRMGGEG